MDFKEKAKILDSAGISRAIVRISHEILEKNKDVGSLAIIGIRDRGEHLAKRIAEQIETISKQRPLLGVLDITLYRDDLSHGSEQPVVAETQMDFNINNKVVVLMDDVLFTGRTIRCALDALVDFGRPKSIQLGVLVDRGHRELPIRPDYVGKNVPTSTQETIVVRLTEVDEKDEVVLCEIK
ncbi:MAG: bifunctional pyr operon transcriptional regulator/uracil phosphoribosyltransferase PyrR [Candidatus Omnitrophota bacterium]